MDPFGRFCLCAACGVARKRKVDAGQAPRRLACIHFSLDEGDIKTIRLKAED
jgi:hypothetical protein